MKFLERFRAATEAEKQKREKLLMLQDLVTGQFSTRLVMKETELKKAAMSQAQNDMRIIDDCERIMNETKNPDTFFSRFDVLLKAATRVERFEPYLNFSIPPSKYIADLNRNKQKMISIFLINYSEDVEEKAAALKTDRARLNRYKKFHESLKPYYSQMNNGNIEYIKNRFSDYENSLR